MQKELLIYFLLDGGVNNMYSSDLTEHNITIQLGIVDQSKSLENVNMTTYEDLINDEYLQDYVHPMTLCKHGIELTMFNFTTRFKQVNMKFKIPWKHTFRFQYFVRCGYITILRSLKIFSWIKQICFI